MISTRSQPDKQTTFSDLRRSTFNQIVVGISLACGVVIWLANLREKSSPAELVLIWLGAELTCLVSWLMRERRPRGAVVVLLLGLWGCIALASVTFPAYAPALFYLFALVSELASVLSVNGSTLALTALSVVFIINRAGPRWADGPFLLPVLTVAATWFTSFIAFRSLSKALDLAWNYQEYAVAQMHEAREHRASLMQLTKTLTEVRQDLERANAQLIYATRAAEESRRLKAQFAANVSHELRTPINLIVGFSETIVLMPEAYGTPMPSAYWADLNTIYRSARHLQSLINDVLDVSQIEAGKMTILKEEVNPLQVVNEAANIQREYIESRGLQFVTHLPDSLPPIYLDRTRVRQVILNLLSNAARFTDSGTITLSARVLQGEGAPSELAISVRDTGMGIPPRDLPAIWEEFHQLEGSLSRRKGGSGLGLALSKQFVELHGGRIWAESDGIPGRGTTFTFTIPLSPTVQNRVDDSLQLVDPEADTRYFVVLDSDPAVGQLFERYAVKHRPICVQDEDAANRLIRTIRPAALVLDVKADHTALLERQAGQPESPPVIRCAMPSGQRNAFRNSHNTQFLRIVTGDALRDAIETLRPGARRVLLIAEDRDVSRMFARMLQSMPYKVLKAYSDAEGWALIREQRPDVVVIDVAGTDAGSMTLLKNVRTEADLAGLPILVTATGGDLDELTPAREGRIEVLKPGAFQPVEMVRCVEALVDSFRPGSVPAPQGSLPGLVVS